MTRVTLEELALRARDWLTVKDIAKMLNVHVDTVRRWEENGKLKGRRHPINNYRLFLADDLGRAESLKNES